MSEKIKDTVKHTVIVLIAAAVGICLGYFVSSYETRFMLGREYQGAYKGVELYTCGDVNDIFYKAHLEMLELAPDELLAGCERIYFTGADIGIPANDSGYEHALGLTQNGVVYVSTQSFGADVVMHELFHTYDSANGMLSDNSPGFRAAFDSENGNIRVIAGSSVFMASEFFAEAGAMYIISPFELSIRAPRTYEYFNTIFDLYE